MGRLSYLEVSTDVVLLNVDLTHTGVIQGMVDLYAGANNGWLHCQSNL